MDKLTLEEKIKFILQELYGKANGSLGDYYAVTMNETTSQILDLFNSEMEEVKLKGRKKELQELRTAFLEHEGEVWTSQELVDIIDDILSVKDKP